MSYPQQATMAARKRPHDNIDTFEEMLETKNQCEFYNNCSHVQRVGYARKVSVLSVRLKKPLFFQVLDRLSALPGDDQLHRTLVDHARKEEPKDDTFVNYWLNLPPMDTMKVRTREEIKNSLDRAEKLLQEHLTGQKEAKRAILQMVKKKMCGAGSVVGLHGPAGNGKTRLAQKVIGPALDRPVIVIPLGGCDNASTLLGHGFTYEGSKPGALVQALVQSGVSDPVILFDEVDKIAKEEVASALIHITDPVQNKNFRDTYMQFPIDLSGCSLIFTYNDATKLSPILRDRINEVCVEKYTTKEKNYILRSQMVPEIQKECATQVEIVDDVYQEILEQCQADPGLRGMKRLLQKAMHATDTNNLMADPTSGECHKVTRDVVRGCLTLEKRMRPLSVMYT